MKERIAELRELAGLNKKEVARLCGWNYSTYTNYEYGIRDLSVENAKHLCESLEPKIGNRFIYLVTGKDISEHIQSDKGGVSKFEALNIFKDVLLRARRLGALEIAGNKADDIVNDFATALQLSQSDVREVLELSEANNIKK